jgi:hypothetical protein
MKKIKREKGFASGLIVPDNLPDEDKMRKGFQATYPIKIKCEKGFASGLIVPSDLPVDKMRGNSQVVKLFQATCPW